MFQLILNPETTIDKTKKNKNVCHENYSSSALKRHHIVEEKYEKFVSCLRQKVSLLPFLENRTRTSSGDVSAVVKFR